MKRYRSAREVLADVEKAISSDQPSRHTDTLQEVTRILHDDRHYLWAGVYLVMGSHAVRVAFSGPEPKHEPCARIALGKGNVGRAAQDGQMRFIPDVNADSAYIRALDETRCEIATPITLVRRVIGVLNVESDREHGLGNEDCVLHKQVAEQLARFLSGSGKYIVRKLREGLTEPEAERGYPPRSERPEHGRKAAAGEKSR